MSAAIAILTGHVIEPPYFEWLDTRSGTKQAFLRFYLNLRGPKKEGDSSARVVMYGRSAEAVYAYLEAGRWVKVEARYRVRQQNGRHVHEFVASNVEFPPAWPSQAATNESQV